MPTIYLALGANLGHRLENLRAAIQHLAPNITVTRCSRIYETEPWGVTDQPRFLNMALQAKTDLSPFELLDALKKIEKKMGRTETVRYGPRVIDLDILLYDDLILQTERLEIPHPRLAERRFVLTPLNDIAPQVIHPLFKQSIYALLQNLNADAGIELFAAEL